MDCSTSGFPVLHYLSEFAQTNVYWVRDGIQPSHSLSPCLLLPSIFPSIRVFSNELALHTRWPKYWSFSFSISFSNEYSGLIFFSIDWLDLLAVQGTLKIFSSTTVQKHQFCSPQPSLWSNSHIHTWLLEKLQLWLDRPLSAKSCLCFLTFIAVLFTTANVWKQPKCPSTEEWRCEIYIYIYTYIHTHNTIPCNH